MNSTDSNWPNRLFACIDEKDLTGFLSFLAPDCLFRFGNEPAVSGIDNIKNTVEYFFDSIAGLSHQLLESYDLPDGKLCHGLVTYTTYDGAELTIPFANILKCKQQTITEYLIFADTSQLTTS